MKYVLTVMTVSGKCNPYTLVLTLTVTFEIGAGFRFILYVGMLTFTKNIILFHTFKAENN